MTSLVSGDGGDADAEVHPVEDYGVTAGEQRRREPLSARLARELPDTGEEHPHHPVPPPATGRQPLWNVVAVARHGHFREALQLLARFGPVSQTRFHDVVTMRVAGPRRLLDELGEALARDEHARTVIARVLPLEYTFVFGSADEFERAVAAIVTELADELAGSTFHVRVHRRGGDFPLDAADEEAFVGEIVLQALEQAGAAARVGFENPDAVIDIETLEGEGGMSLWTADDLRDYPFLRVT